MTILIKGKNQEIICIEKNKEVLDKFNVLEVFSTLYSFKDNSQRISFTIFIDNSNREINVYKYFDEKTKEWNYGLEENSCACYNYSEKDIDIVNKFACDVMFLFLNNKIEKIIKLID